MILTTLFSEPMVFVAILTSIILALSIHEFAHAWVANLLGDNTAEHMGRLTLNPLAHIDPMGMLLLLMAGFGWGRPVPVNPNNLRKSQYGEALVSVAGPVSNLILATFSFLLIKFLLPVLNLPMNNLLVIFLLFFMHINIILMVFNLIPIPPLDGSKILFNFLPPKYFYIRMNLERNGPMILLFLLILDSFSGFSIFGTLFNGVLNFVNKLL